MEAGEEFERLKISREVTSVAAVYDRRTFTPNAVTLSPAIRRDPAELRDLSKGLLPWLSLHSPTTSTSSINESTPSIRNSQTGFVRRKRTQNLPLRHSKRPLLWSPVGSFWKTNPPRKLALFSSKPLSISHMR